MCNINIKHTIFPISLTYVYKGFERFDREIASLRKVNNKCKTLLSWTQNLSWYRKYKYLRFKVVNTSCFNKVFRKVFYKNVF